MTDDLKQLDSTARIRCVAGPALVAIVGAVMLAWTWGTWPDVLVDFGRELYVPWRLSEGDALYRDIAHFNGPLSAYGNALLFRLFGDSLLTLVVANAVIAALTIAGLHDLLRDAAGRFGAAVAGIIFVTLFACLQTTGIGNYNFIAPYAHELTHGCALSVLVLWCLGRFLRAGARRWVIAAGVALGLVFLTKVEVLVAAAAAAGTALALSGRCRPRVAALFAAAFAAPIFVAAALLAIPLSPGEAVEAIVAPWALIGNDAVRELRFYKVGMGTADVGASVGAMAAMVGWYAALFVPATVAALLARSARAGAILAVATFVAVGVALWVVPETMAWFSIGRPLPLFMAAVAAGTLLAWWRSGDDVERRRRNARGAALAVFAGALLLKMALNARLHHYGFVLAMPATLVTVVALLEWTPAAIARGGSAAVFRAAALAGVAVTIAAYLGVASIRYANKPYIIGAGGDRFRVDERGRRVIESLDAIESRLGPGDTLAVIPEGVMINYLLRRRNPTPYINFMPPEFLLFGEASMLGAYEADPPDVIVVAAKGTSEYGVGDFGVGYGEAFWTWISRHYRVVERRDERPQPIWIMVPSRPANRRAP